MLKKIWKDSVWSKVIATGIIGIITFLYLQFIRISEKITFKEAYNKITDVKISVIYVLGIVLIFLILKAIVKRIFFDKKSLYNKKQKKLREFNKLKDDEIGILFKWIVYFKHNGTPFINDLTGFCTKHNEVPIKLINGNCPMNDCDNYRIKLDEFKIENHIESMVINEWDIINKKM